VGRGAMFAVSTTNFYAFIFGKNYPFSSEGLLWTAELTMGQWVMGQMGQQIWMGHLGHGSVSMTN